jgi:hypothetical protein
VETFRPFRFLKVLHLPGIRVSWTDLADKLNLDNQLEPSKEHSNQLASALLETACKALGREIHSLQCVILVIELLQYSFYFSANVRRRGSRDSSWVEVHVYGTYS